MSENKRYYWIKLPSNFFQEKLIKKIRALPGGDIYTIITLKILLLGLNNNNRIFYDNIEATFEEEIALEIDEQVEAVTVTLNILEKSGWIIREDDETLYSPKAEELTGSESASTIRSRKCRSNKKALQCNTNATLCNGEIDIEKEIEIEIEKDICENKNSQIEPFQENKKPSSNAKRFKKPTVDEINAYCTERGNSVDAGKFYDFYESKGWVVGKTPMKDWKAAVRTWERGSSSTSNSRADSTADKSRMEWIYEMCENPNAELPF